jgi:pimeloyl-[acyl-carrier protein] methyl ester esterase
MNTALHVDCRGGAASALPLVCLHGWGMNLAVFDALRDALSDIESWAVDLPGHGRSAWESQRAEFDSQVEDVLAVLPQSCVLLGWSLGGKMAMEIARRQPGRVAALVLVSTTPRFTQAADWPYGLNAGELEAFRSLLDQDWRQTLSDFVWLQLRGSRNAEAAQQRVETALATHGAPDAEALRVDLDLLGQLDLRAGVASIRQPALLIAGQNDRVTSVDATRWIAAALPRSNFAVIPRAGHASFISHTEEFVALLRPFLAEVAVAA